MDNNLKREIIIDNYENPFHREIKEEKDFIKANTNNESCIDNIDLYVKIVDDKIVDAYFDGEACAITTSATSIMLKKIIGKTREEARELMTEYYHMINEESYNEDFLGELNVYNDISRQPSRKKCAIMPFQTLEKTFKIKYANRNEQIHLLFSSVLTAFASLFFSSSMPIFFIALTYTVFSSDAGILSSRSALLKTIIYGTFLPSMTDINSLS